MWYLFIIAAIILLVWAAWLIAWYHIFWVMLLLNLPIIVLLALKMKAELHDAKKIEKYQVGAIIGFCGTLFIFLLDIQIPLLLITDFLLITFIAVKGMEYAEKSEKRN